jgi:hypothetical protein
VAPYHDPVAQVTYQFGVGVPQAPGYPGSMVSLQPGTTQDQIGSNPIWGAQGGYGEFGTGSLTFQTLTDTTAAGVFSFSLPQFGPIDAKFASTKVLTNGSFSVRLCGDRQLCP